MSSIPAAEMDFLSGGGELGAMMRAMDWSRNPLGPPSTWPRALKTSVRIMLTSRQPMFVWWGPELINLYNDAYRAIVGGKHPQALGQPARVVWREIWDQVAPRAESALRGDEGTYDEALLLIMERYGYKEETYYTFSYSPVPNDEGGTGGILCANSDDTLRILGERQLALLRDLAARTGDARTIGEACELSARSLETDRRDLPFALIYLTDDQSQEARLAGAAGIAPGHAAAPESMPTGGNAIWPIHEVLNSNTPIVVEPLPTELAPLPAGDWDQPPHRAVILPIPGSGQTGPAGVLIAALNPYRVLNDSYRGFLDLAAGQIAAAIANAQAYEDERRRAEALAEIDRAKTAFFSNVSHEFRTPLMLMLGPAADALQDRDEPLTPAQRERITIVQRNGLRLLKLVNTLLDFSRIEARRMRAEFRLTDLAGYTAGLASVFRSAVERAGMELVIHCPPLPEPVAIDPDMWEKIVLNLVSNAFKFTFEGRITVSLVAENGQAVLRVSDTGTGIPATELPHIFERFHRVDGARGRTYEGTGIGLALVQELVKLHGGSVGAESVEGRGSTFTVTIPLRRAESERAMDMLWEPGGPRASAFVEEAQRWLPENSLDGFDHASSEVAGPRARILLADDNADMREYVARLIGERHEVEAVANGRAALEAIRSRRHDLLLTDVMMPEMDGFGLLKTLRGDPDLKTLPVILISARAGEEATVDGLAAGADDYLVKPFSSRELLARIDGTLKLARLRQEAFLREQQLRAEAEAARARLVEVLESISSGFVGLAPDWHFTYVNRVAARMARREVLEMVGSVIWEEWPDLQGTILQREFERAFRENVEVRFQFLYPPYDSWFEFRAYPGENGLSVFVDDITESKRIAEQLRQTAKLESLGVLAGGVAHDFNNLLVGILGNASLAQEMLPQEHPAHGVIGEALRASERAADLTKQLLAYSGKGRFVVEVINLGEMVRENLTLLKSSISRNVELRLDLSPGTPLIEADRAQMQQVVMNLLINAAEAVGEKPGHILVRTCAQSVDEQYLSARPDLGHLAPGEYTAFSVTDDGIGMDADTRSKIFDPFFTTKFTGRGLGLAAVLGIVRGHQGGIDVRSALGRGTTFELLFPAYSKVSARSEKDGARPGSQPMILVVDDEDIVCRTARNGLERKGYRVITAANGRVALEVLHEEPDVKLVLLDLTMPVMSAEEALPLIKAVRPDLPVVLTSGYSENDVVERFAGRGLAGFIQKPFKAGELAEKVRGVLEQAKWTAGGARPGVPPKL